MALAVNWAASAIAPTALRRTVPRQYSRSTSHLRELCSGIKTTDQVASCVLLGQGKKRPTLGLIMGLVVASKCVLDLDGCRMLPQVPCLAACATCEHASRRLWPSVPCLALEPLPCSRCGFCFNRLLFSWICATCITHQMPGICLHVHMSVRGGF